MRIFPSASLRAELRANLALALPLLAAQLLFVSMGTVDTIVAGRLGAAPLAAVAVGSNLWFMVFVPFWGLFMAVSPIVAQRLGGGKPAAGSGRFLRGALALAAACGVAWMLVLLALVDPVLDWLSLEDATRRLSVEYLHAIAPGALPFALFLALRNAAEGYGQTRATLWAGLAGFVVNAVLAYGLANGAWGLPALGPRGCGVATATAGAVMVLVFAPVRRAPETARAGALRAGRLRGLAGIGMGACFALVSASLMALLPGPIVALYTDAPGVAALAAGFLHYAAVFQVADCVQATANGALRGVKDTRVPMLITVSAYWLVGLPLAVALAFHTALGPVGVWVGFIAGLAVAAAGLSARFLRRTMRAP
jgi:MATE family multidrug resistance protein